MATPPVSCTRGHHIFCAARSSAYARLGQLSCFLLPFWFYPIAKVIKLVGQTALSAQLFLLALILTLSKGAGKWISRPQNDAIQDGKNSRERCRKEVKRLGTAYQRKQAGKANIPTQAMTANAADGRCRKRTMLRSPMQRAARTSTACCDGRRTALRQQPNCTTHAGSTLLQRKKQYCGLPVQAYRHGLANRLGNGNQQYCFCLSVCLFWQGYVLPYRLQFNTCCRIACPSSG